MGTVEDGDSRRWGQSRMRTVEDGDSRGKGQLRMGKWRHVLAMAKVWGCKFVGKGAVMCWRARGSRTAVEGRGRGTVLKGAWEGNSVEGGVGGEQSCTEHKVPSCHGRGHARVLPPHPTPPPHPAPPPAITPHLPPGHPFTHLATHVSHASSTHPAVSSRPSLGSGGGVPSPPPTPPPPLLPAGGAHCASASSSSGYPAYLYGCSTSRPLRRYSNTWQRTMRPSRHACGPCPPAAPACKRSYACCTRRNSTRAPGSGFLSGWYRRAALLRQQGWLVCGGAGKSFLLSYLVGHQAGARSEALPHHLNRVGLKNAFGAMLS
eukprot:366246-Chlamydomonas_euryale.AAC.3